MTELYLIRHGETLWNNTGRYTGQQDIPLNDTGLYQARLVAGALAHMPFAAIYTSDLQRAVDTAETVAVPHRLTPIPDPRLREGCAGEWEGLTMAEIEERWPAEVAKRRANAKEHCAPGGESLAALYARVDTALREILARHTDGKVAIVSHGGTICALIGAALGASLMAFGRIRLDNCAYSVIRARNDGLLVLTKVNDTCHLKAGGCILPG